ncbi:Uncharacterized protein dnm_030400 [Desulfonema magnum]|uniref:Uncharacterized protein n=1 Tax=Desulfonema magnum TaxID=45655 RepID=A0A975GNM6_9BACT|nr:Uncharacterized protein dnm_030400 [Desulfonema magnum]
MPFLCTPGYELSPLDSHPNHGDKKKFEIIKKILYDKHFFGKTNFFC